MRYRKALLGSPVKTDLRVEFTEPGLSSYAGLELFIRYLRSIRFNELVRQHVPGTGLGGDYGAVVTETAMVRKTSSPGSQFYLRIDGRERDTLGKCLLILRRRLFY